jgi:NIMA (never in mitosis gene a)-related kinase
VIKQVDIANMSEEERRETVREGRILEVLNHPNIVRFREVYKTKKGKLCIVMDYADGGDLQSKIKERAKQKDPSGRLNFWSEDELLNLFTQICLAMKHVHDKKILHRDLKSQNIFMTKRGLVKLGDFGIARVLSNTRSRAKTVVGTPYYLSPEIIKSESYNFKSDIWSLGVLLYEMAALQPPFNAQSLHQLAQRIIAGKYSPVPSHFSKDVSNLIAMMLQRDPAKRPTVHQLLQVPCIEMRITRFLKADVFKEEFAHTLLHNQNVFEEFRKI